MYTPGFLGGAVVYSLGSGEEGGVSELGEIPDDGPIQRSNPQTGMRDGPEWLVSKTEIEVRPMARKGRNQI